MNKILILLLFAITLITVQSCSSTIEDSNDNFKQTISRCNSCHSSSATIGKSAPLLGGLDNKYLIEQMKNFRFNKRGVYSLSDATQEMSRQVKALKNDEIIRIAGYYEDQPIINSIETVVGNINNGKMLYTDNCEGCHSSSFGRFFTKSPKISHLNGPYILDQLTLFRANQRHFYTENKHRIKMIAVSKLFNKEELSDIAAYIKSKALNE